MGELVALEPEPARERHFGVRLAAWTTLWALMAAGNFAANATSSPKKTTGTPIFFQLSFGIGGLFVYGVLLAVVVVIATGLPIRETFALRRPNSIPRAIGLGMAVIAITIVASAIVSPFANPGKEQGILPRHGWVHGHVLAFALSFLTVAVAAPIVEESMFRGLGFRLLARFGRTIAIVGVGVAFGLAHGIPAALPILIPLGAGLAWMRDRTDSIYPGMVLHGLFNAVQVIIAVA